MHPWHDISIGKNAPREVNAIIEIPRGSDKKYELNLKTGKYKLDRESPVKSFPIAYGFIPQTLADDNDPLDIMVLTDKKLKRGDRIKVIPVAMLQVWDNKLRDDKILAVPVADVKFKRNLKDIKDKIGYFFKTYKRGITIKRWRSKTGARKEIIACADKYKKVFE